MSRSNCCFLTCFQVSQEAGQVVWYSHPFKKFPQFAVVYIVKGFGITNKAEIDVFSGILLIFLWSNRCWLFDLWLLCLFKFSLNIWKFMVHILLKPCLKDFEYYLASIWNDCTCAIVWTFFGIALLWDWNEDQPFQSCDHWWVFQICWYIKCSTLIA